MTGAKKTNKTNAPVAQTKFFVAESPFVRGNKEFHALPSIQTLLWRDSSTAICNRCLANRTQLCRPARQHWCFQSSAICTPDFYFTMGDAPERSRAWATTVAQTRFTASSSGATAREKTPGFVRFLTSKHHLGAAVPLRSAASSLLTRYCAGDLAQLHCPATLRGDHMLN